VGESQESCSSCQDMDHATVSHTYERVFQSFRLAFQVFGQSSGITRSPTSVAALPAMQLSPRLICSSDQLEAGAS
jgi:hypothetical protein